MRTQTVTLSPSGTTESVQLSYYDGEWLAVQITRGGVTGQLAMAIASLERGDTPTEARIDRFADVSDQVVLSPTDLSQQPEGSTWYWTIWAFDTAGTPVAQAKGTLARRAAIRTALSPTITSNLTFGADTLIFGAGNPLIFTAA